MRRTEIAPTPRFTGGGGSNRDSRAHEAALDAAAALIEEVGYERLTMEAIAKRADVGKPTLYRWWKNKAAIAHEVMLTYAGTMQFVDSGSLQEDIRAFVTQTVRFFDVPLVRVAWPGAVADLRADPAAWQLAFDTLTRPAVDHLELVLRKAIERGECRADADHHAVFDVITGACMSELLTPGRRRSKRRRIESSVDLVLRGLEP